MGKHNDDAAAVMVKTRHFKTKRDQVRLGDYVYAHVVIAGQELELPAEVLDVRQQLCDDGTRQTSLYVHYENRDRRLDEWIMLDRVLDKSPVTAKTITRRREIEQPLTRSQRRIQEEFSHIPKSINDLDATTAKLEKQHEERTKIKNVQRVVIGSWEADVWYYSPYPTAVVDGFVETLYICEFCLFYYTDYQKYSKHITTGCVRRQPPGQVIYRHNNLEVYEVFGNVYKLYCQCLCLLSKLFLDHKTLYYEVENFRFYVLCEVDDQGAHLVGHFSKEYGTNNNLACIMVLPCHQRKGYGKLLIQLSYALSTLENRIGTPEKPLSDLGKVSYRSYWWWILMNAIEENGWVNGCLVSELSSKTHVHPDDIISTLSALQMIKLSQANYGDDIVLCSPQILNHCKKLPFCKAPKLEIQKQNLRWSTNEELVPVLKEKEVLKHFEKHSPSLTPSGDAEMTPTPEQKEPEKIKKKLVKKI
ncbi:unnamed protein product [Bursaphelenchus xylophilus]|uniref:Histone acetyltransferase n=1 Tax=Bursaphelenchus xylophilus TaxID=6326 RepID=A0A1I7RT98_BURXY|nr:unnamed protein product [Bursaphelenchus xylophilus]CAG9122527.1 unnamed protein product [Bursaphelenchus xylophilus]